MKQIIHEYGKLLQLVDCWFRQCTAAYPDSIACRSGCSACCRGLFDITLLDAFYLNNGFLRLPKETQEELRDLALSRVRTLQVAWPEFSEPFILNYKAEEDWEALMPDEDETPCLLLDESGQCMLYEYRPMTCRLHGIPHIDATGEVLFDEWCSRNFVGLNPLGLPLLRGGLMNIFKQELSLFRTFARQLLGRDLSELDTFIPTSLLIDFNGFDWPAWLEGTPLVLNARIEEG